MAVRLKGAALKKLRQEVVERDYGACVLCGKAAGEIHHIVFRGSGGDDSLDNLVCVCLECHQSAHGRGNHPETQGEIREVLLEYTGGFAKGADEGGTGFGQDMV